jgi:phosphohistidine phosphatase
MLRFEDGKANYHYLSKMGKMKNLFVIRHAKSSWANPGQDDFDRPLNDRGERDAPVMAKRLWENGIRLDAIISSPAVRALTTAQYFAKQFGIKNKEIIILKHLYHAPAETFYDVIENDLNDKWESVAIFSHNPGITYFINSLGLVHLDNLPTCGIFGVGTDVKQWNEFKESKKRFLLFDYPKNAVR